MTSYYQPYWIKDDELEHFGIKGMKWGIRRYQNQDGTLTEAGKKRYGSVEKLEQVKARNERYKQVAKTAAIATAGVIATTAAANLAYGAASNLVGSQIANIALNDAKFASLSGVSRTMLNSLARVFGTSTMSEIRNYRAMEEAFAAKQAEAAAFSAQVAADMERKKAEYDAQRAAVEAAFAEFDKKYGK